MILLPNEQNFDLDKNFITAWKVLKENHKISNIPKFRCETFAVSLRKFAVFQSFCILRAREIVPGFLKKVSISRA
jgi:hypothetical protein